MNKLIIPHSEFRIPHSSPEPYDGFIYAALGWFLLAAIGNPIIFWLFETASDAKQFLFRIAMFNIPYRDVELFGIGVVRNWKLGIRNSELKNHKPGVVAMVTPSLPQALVSLANRKPLASVNLVNSSSIPKSEIRIPKSKKGRQIYEKNLP